MKREDKRDLFVVVALAVVLVVGLLPLLLGDELMGDSVVGLWGGIYGKEGLRYPVDMDFGADGIVSITNGSYDDTPTELHYTFDGLTVRITDTVVPKTGITTTCVAQWAVVGDEMNGEGTVSSGRSTENFTMTLQRRQRDRSPVRIGI